MKINITAGEFMNELLKEQYPDELFVPFNEAMSVGTFTCKPFADAFVKERAETHKAAEEDYRHKLGPFMEFLNNAALYSKIVLWFGDDAFCKTNQQFVIKTISETAFCGSLTLNIVDELTGKIQISRNIQYRD